jgi:hypothetical protein
MKNGIKAKLKSSIAQGIHDDAQPVVRCFQRTTPIFVATTRDPSSEGLSISSFYK